MGNTWESGIDINAEHTSKVLQSEIEAEHRKTFGFLQIGLISLTFQKRNIFSKRSRRNQALALETLPMSALCEASVDSGSSDGVCTHQHHLACTLSITQPFFSSPHKTVHSTWCFSGSLARPLHQSRTSKSSIS